MSTIKAGIIGTGFIGPAHVEAARRLGFVEMVGLCEAGAELAKSKAELEVDLGSIDLASEESEAEVKRPKWFDTAKFPTARFVSSAFRAVAPDRYEVAGKLTIKGITRDAIVPITLKKDVGGTSTVEGSFTIKRLDYKIGEAEWADPETVGEEVLVRIRMVLPAVNNLAA